MKGETGTRYTCILYTNTRTYHKDRPYTLEIGKRINEVWNCGMQGVYCILYSCVCVQRAKEFQEKKAKKKRLFRYVTYIRLEVIVGLHVWYL